MKSIKSSLLILIAILTLTSLILPAKAASLKAGAAKADLTPEKPVYLGGYYMATSRSVGVHDKLYTRALALDDGAGHKLVLVSMDVVILGMYMTDEIKNEINKRLGIPQECISITATHDHTGPEGYYEEFGKYPKEYDPEMKKRMENIVIGAVEEAVKNMKPAKAGTVTLDMGDYLHNRHDSKGPKDPVGILLIVTDESGKPFAGFLNFPSHGTVAPIQEMKISADWPGVLTGDMETRLGAGSVFLFLQGATGNISPSTKGGEGWEEVNKYGKAVADFVWPKVSEVKTTADFPIAGAAKKLTLPVRTQKTVREFAKTIPDKEKEINASNLPDGDKKEHLSWLRGRSGVEMFMQTIIPTMKRVKNKKTETIVQAMRLGDTLLTTFPGEPIAEVSQEVRSELSPWKVVVLGYTSDHLGYLTTKKVYKEGGYEAGMSLVYPEATEELVNTVVGLAKELEK